MWLWLWTLCFSRYGWRTTEWTECRVDPLLSQQDKRRGNQTALCGGGIQTREVYCVQTNGELFSSSHNGKEGKLCFLFNLFMWKAKRENIVVICLSYIWLKYSHLCHCP